METSNSLKIIEQNHPAMMPSTNPVAVYLASLGSGSRRAMKQALRVITEMLTGTEADPASLPWWNIQYQHTQAIRSRLMERYSPASTNKMLAALRGVLRESWRLGFMDAETLSLPKTLSDKRLSFCAQIQYRVPVLVLTGNIPDCFEPGPACSCEIALTTEGNPERLGPCESSDEVFGRDRRKR